MSDQDPGDSDDTRPLQPQGAVRSEAHRPDDQDDEEEAPRGGQPRAAEPALSTTHWGNKYLGRDERIQLIIRPHIAMIAGSALLAFVAALAAFIVSPANGRWDLSDVVWYLFWWLFLRFAWDAFFWWRERIVITDQRIFRVTGIFIREVGSMPLRMLTDLAYRRTVPGYLLGYGRFTVESAGQDQALSVIDFVPEPDRVYRIINTLVF